MINPPEKLQANYNTFFESVLVRHDNDDPYGMSGWLIGKIGDIYYMTAFGHCSCYGTFDCITGTESYSGDHDLNLNLNWTGTYEQLIHMAENMLDPDMSGRVADPSDYDYGYISACYEEFLRDHKKDGILTPKEQIVKNLQNTNPGRDR